MVGSIYIKVTFSQLNHSSRAKDAGDVFDEFTIVLDLDVGEMTGRTQCSKTTHPRRQKSRMNYIELAIEVLQSIVDVVDFAPAGFSDKIKAVQGIMGYLRLSGTSLVLSFNPS